MGKRGEKRFLARIVLLDMEVSPENACFQPGSAPLDLTIQ
jgi:hypothetical protein